MANSDALPVILVQQIDSSTTAQMSEGRRTQIVLLDDRRLDIVVQPKLFVNELLNIVASHCHLKDSDKQYFGLAFYDESQQCHWLQNERRVLDHEYPRKFIISGATLTLLHLPKFFVESITHLSHASCVELLFLHTRSQMAKGFLEAANTTLCQLGAYAMQACYGDFEDHMTARNQMKSSHLFSQRLSKDSMALSQCEDLLVESYQNHRGLSKGRAIVNFMVMAEQLQSYGVQVFEVQDKAGVSLSLGISSRGIYQYELNCLEKPRRVFYWKQLENLYYRERKFSIEVNDIGRVVHTLSSFNVYEDAIQEPVDEYDDLTEAIGDPSTQVSVSRRAFLPSGVYVHVFWCESAQLCKTIWSLAIAQHQFYLDRKATAKKGVQLVQHTVEELSTTLDRMIEDGASSIGKTNNNSSDCASTMTKLSSSVSCTSLKSVPSSERSEEDKQRDAELCKRLKQKRAELEQRLLERMKDLKETCVKEGEVTGELPSEIHLALAPGENEPKIKRRVGTAFAITFETMTKHTKADQIAKLEADVDIHRKIVAAGLKLANDSTTNKSVRKKRRRDYEANRQRLRELEQRLHQLRISSSKPDLPNVHLDGALSKLSENGSSSSLLRVSKSLPGTPHGSVPDLSSASNGTSTSTADGLDFRGEDNSEHHRHHHVNGLVEKLSSAFSPVRRSKPPNLPLPPLPPPSSPRRRQASSDQIDSPGGSHKGFPHSTSFPSDQLTTNGSGDAQRSPMAERNQLYSSKPPPGSNGYRTPQSVYQSTYRCQNYPTFSSTNGIISNAKLPQQATLAQSESNHSLPSTTTSEKSTSIVDHSLGAYNIPNQRMSWDYECVSSMNNGVVAALLQGSSESLNVPVTRGSSSELNGGGGTSSKFDILKGRIKGFSSGDFHSGSLDRRLLNQRKRELAKQKKMEEWKAMQKEDAADPSIAADRVEKRPIDHPAMDARSLDNHPIDTLTSEPRLPTKLPSPAIRLLDQVTRTIEHPTSISIRQIDHQESISPRITHKCLTTSPLVQHSSSAKSPHFHNGGIETSKPYETSDLLKYSSIRSPNERSSTIDSDSDPNHRFPFDQNHQRHPPPPHRFLSPDLPHRHLPSSPSDQLSRLAASPADQITNRFPPSIDHHQQRLASPELAGRFPQPPPPDHIHRYSSTSSTASGDHQHPNRFHLIDPHGGISSNGRKHSSTSIASSNSSPQPSPGRKQQQQQHATNNGTPRKIDNWWTSQVANGAKRSYTSYNGTKIGQQQQQHSSSSSSMTESDKLVQEALAWYDDQDPSSPTKTPTIV